MVELIKEHYSYDVEKMGQVLARMLRRQRVKGYPGRRDKHSITVLKALLLIDAGANVNFKAYYGDFALNFAC